MPRRRRAKNDPTITLVVHLCVALFSVVVYVSLALVKGLRALFKAAPEPQPGKVASPKARSKRSTQGPRMVNITDEEDIPLTVKTTQVAKDKSFKIPKEPAEKRRWVKPGEVVEVAGVRIEGGMIYVGASLTLPRGGNDPSLIIPRKAVAEQGDFTQLKLGYWPSYESIEPGARRAYLNWLAQGRNHPDALIGYVFLFFYGLERRVLVDAKDSEEAKAELPLIVEELDRLIALYGSKNASFYNYAYELREWVYALLRENKSYLLPLPTYPKSSKHFPVKIVIALGQAARDKVPVPAEVALGWAFHHPDIKIKPAALQNQDKFLGIFRLLYKKEFGEGLMWPRSSRSHEVTYAASSAAFQGNSIHHLELRDVQQVFGINEPLEKLRPLLEQTVQALGGLAQNQTFSQATLEQVYLRMSPKAWPEFAKKALVRVENAVQQGMVSGTFYELFSDFRIEGQPDKFQVATLAQVLESAGICMRPNVLQGDKLPQQDSFVVLYEARPLDGAQQVVEGYLLAQLMLEMAAVFSKQYIKFTSKQTLFMCQHIESWKDIAPVHLVHLAGHLRYVNHNPSTVAALKSRAKKLSVRSRQTVAGIMVQALQVDAPSVGPAHIKMLEHLYNWLGLDKAEVFSDVHTAQTGGTLKGTEHRSRKTGDKPAKESFSLDYDKVKALQADTQKVSELLSGIFTDEEVDVGAKPKTTSAPNIPRGQAPTQAQESEAAVSSPATPGQSADQNATDGEKRPILPGLDFAHNALARLLLAQPQWAREELQIQAKKLDLMLDGALEQLNEACFDAHDAAFTEGDDPIEVNPEIIEILKA